MNSEQIVKEIVETGRELLEKGLVARTWGNVSARIDSKNFYITPSGLDYISMKEEDIVKYNIESEEWEGKHKPSGERGVHKASYENYPDVNFVIHTHQNFATAIGLCGFDKLDITSEEQSRLGGVALAAYGLPGRKKLTNAVDKALKTGAHVILMAHHGALVLGKDKAEAMERVIIFEEICKRNTKGQPEEFSDEKRNSLEKKAEDIEKKLHEKYEYVKCIISPEVFALSEKNKPVIAQMDDMAQMIGRKIIVANLDNIEKALEKSNAVIVKDLGVIVRASDTDDLLAMEMLVKKTAIGKLHADALKVKAELSVIDCALMHLVYIKKYSKQKG